MSLEEAFKTHESQELKICQKCSKNVKRMDHFLPHKEISTSFSSTALDGFLPSFVTNDDIPNNDSVLFYYPSSSTVPDISETFAEVPDSIIPNNSIAEKFDITDRDIDGNFQAEALAVDSDRVVPDIPIPLVTLLFSAFYYFIVNIIDYMLFNFQVNLGVISIFSF